MSTDNQQEIYTPKVHDVGTHLLIEWIRLVPGSIEPESMGRYFDFSDAARDRRDAWPNGVEVEPEEFATELAKRLHALISNPARLCTGLLPAGNDCGAAMVNTCTKCHRPVCLEHAPFLTPIVDNSPRQREFCTVCLEDFHRQGMTY